MTPALLLLLAYSALLIGAGLYVGRRVRTTAQFFTADRRLSPVLLATTLLAANIGAGSTVGAAGLGYRDGLAAWWWVGAAAIGSAVQAFWIGPRIYTIARQHNLSTVGDYLELRYGAAVRGLIALLLWIGTLAILAGQLIALAFVLNAAAGIPRAMGCVIGGAVMTIYFVAGGLLTSVWVNVIELIVLLAGFALAIPFALASVGGWAGLQTATAAMPDFWNVGRSGNSGWMYLALLGPAFVVSPGLLQKIYGARDRRTAVIGTGVNAFGLLLFAAVPPLLGMMARVLHPDLVNRELALPTLLVHDVPPWVGSVALAALFSAEVSTADAILFMLATSLSQDLYRRFLNPQASDARVLTVARGAAAAGGAAAIALALTSASIIGALSIFYAVLGVSLFVPLIVGMLDRRLGAHEVMAAVAGGTAVLAATRLHDFGIDPAQAGLCACVAAYALVRTARLVLGAS